MVLSEETRQRRRAERLARCCIYCGRYGVIAHNLCGTCYAYVRRNNDPPPLVRPRCGPSPVLRPCRHCHYQDYRLVHGLCLACYQYSQRHGYLRDLGGPITTPRAQRPQWHHVTPQQRLACLLLEQEDVAPHIVCSVVEQTEAALEDLDPRLAYVISRRVGLRGYSPGTFQQVGDELGLTRARSYQLECEALKELRPRVNQPPARDKN